MRLTRRGFLAQSALLAQPAARSFYTVREQGGRWWLFTPAGEKQLTLGLNHIDPAGLRYAENGSLWRDKYGNSMRRWLEESVRPNLRRWGFNCVGWSQEVVTRGLTNHRHSRAWTFEEYQWLNMPYCHLLPFADFHQWEAETRNPSLFSSEFADWCDHVAREHCVTLANDPKLIGYFFIDCPTWVHTKQWSAWKGPMFDPKQLDSAAGRKQLQEMAAQYYRVTSAAIRRYDKHHLIFGDRYEAAEPIPREVVQAALPYVDALCFQHFAPPERIAANLAHWHKETGKPVFVADSAGNVRGENGAVLHNPKHYPAVLAEIRKLPGAIGYHLCGAYTTNRTRRRGLLDEQERPNQEVVDAITQANREAADWAREGKS